MRTLARALLVVAVLLAQQTALAHQYWHVSVASVTADAHATEDDRLCELHDLLGTILGVAGCDVPAQTLLASADICFVAAAAVAAEALPPTPYSRGPPSRS